MKEDNLGCLHPVVDSSICTGCGMCSNICPANALPVLNVPEECFAAWVDSFSERKDCASGGVATRLTKLYLENGGSAYGTRYGDDLVPVIDSISTDTLDLYKGSRYVQSITGDAFVRIKTELQEGRKVLFIGTPCQVAGLYGFLHRPYDNLTTCDLVCHGVCPESYLKSEVAILKKKHQLQNVSDIRFRSNDKRYDYCLSLWDDKGKAVYCKSEREQPYFRGFLSNVLLRESCYHCQYAAPQRVADISLGDNTAFDKSSFGNKTDNVNISLILVSTDKGKNLIAKLKNSESMTFVERCADKETAGIQSLTAPVHQPFSSRMFRVLYRLTGYRFASRTAIGPQILYIKLHHAAHLLRKKLGI